MESTKCVSPNCNEFRIPLVSKQPHSLGRRFMKCQTPGCGGFNWIDQASSSVVLRCFSCGDESHFARNCPYNNSPCNDPICAGICKLLTSKQPHSLGRKFLKCTLCDRFTWWSKPMKDSSSEYKPMQTSSSRTTTTSSTENSSGN